MLVYLSWLFMLGACWGCWAWLNMNGLPDRVGGSGTGLTGQMIDRYLYTRDQRLDTIRDISLVSLGTSMLLAFLFFTTQ